MQLQISKYRKLLAKAYQSPIKPSPAELGNYLGVTQNFANNLKRLIDERKTSQKDLAKKVGVSQSLMSRWCAGDHLPRPHQWDRLTKYLKCSYADLVADPDHIETPKAPLYDDLIEAMAKRAGLKVVRDS